MMRFRSRSRASSSVSSSIVSASVSAEASDKDEPFLDDPIITVQVSLSDIPDYVLLVHGDSHPALTAAPRARKTWYGRTISDTGNTSGTISVRMRSSEYHQYFAKDRKTGEYLDHVKPPSEGRSEWISKRLQYQDVWWSEDASSPGGRRRTSSTAVRKVEEWFGRSA